MNNLSKNLTKNKTMLLFNIFWDHKLRLLYTSKIEDKIALFQITANNIDLRSPPF
jgi:hypothetical protein